MATPRQVAQVLGPNWVYNPRTRGVENPMTDEKMSRRQFDKLYGTLAAEGHTSYEAKAKARREIGLAGFRKVPGKRDTYELTVEREDVAKRKGIIGRLPGQHRVIILEQGDDPRKKYGRRRTKDVWRTMNFARRLGTATPMPAGAMHEIWDKRAYGASTLGKPKRWVIRVITRR